MYALADLIGLVMSPHVMLHRLWSNAIASSSMRSSPRIRSNCSSSSFSHSHACVFQFMKRVGSNSSKVNVTLARLSVVKDPVFVAFYFGGFHKLLFFVFLIFNATSDEPESNSAQNNYFSFCYCFLIYF